MSKQWRRFSARPAPLFLALRNQGLTTTGSSRDGRSVIRPYSRWIPPRFTHSSWVVRASRKYEASRSR